MFAVAVAVGLTPEMLPVIVTTNLARACGATVEAQGDRPNGSTRSRSGRCVDRAVCGQDRHVDRGPGGLRAQDRPEGRPDGQAAEYAYLALSFQASPRDPAR